MLWLKIADTLANLALGLTALWVTGRLLFAHLEEARSNRATDPETKRKHRIVAESFRRLASFQHPMPLIAIFLGTLTKLLVGPFLYGS